MYYWSSHISAAILQAASSERLFSLLKIKILSVLCPKWKNSFVLFRVSEWGFNCV